MSGPEVFKDVDWPFPGGRFPEVLGAAIQRTVLTGEAPALYVGHAEDNSWFVGDGVTDPNVPGALTIGHMTHVVERNSAVAELADLPPGWAATRTAPGQPWRRGRLNWLSPDEEFSPPGDSTSAGRIRQASGMESGSPKSEWASRLPGGPQLRDGLARVVEDEGGRDEAENSFFEAASDPQFVATETAQRRFKGQLRRRLRHRQSKARELPSEGR